eukprot:219443_1
MAITEPYPRTMRYAKIYCPDNGPYASNQPKSCHINCDGDDLMKWAEIFAVEGFNDITISATNYSNKWCYRGGTMNCKQDFSSNCPIFDQPNDNGWECSSNQNTDFICNTHTITHSPTISPTIPTISPSINPSTTPTAYPT